MAVVVVACSHKLSPKSTSQLSNPAIQWQQRVLPRLIRQANNIIECMYTLHLSMPLIWPVGRSVGRSGGGGG